MKKFYFQSNLFSQNILNANSILLAAQRHFLGFVSPKVTKLGLRIKVQIVKATLSRDNILLLDQHLV